MEWLSIDDDGNAAHPLCRTDQRCIFRSKSFIVSRSEDVAAIDRPSGDQRGEAIPRDPGRTVIFLVARSSTLTTLPASLPASGLVEKAILSPSGDHVGSVWRCGYSGSSLWG